MTRANLDLRNSLEKFIQEAVAELPPEIHGTEHEANFVLMAKSSYLAGVGAVCRIAHLYGNPSSMTDGDRVLLDILEEAKSIINDLRS